MGFLSRTVSWAFLGSPLHLVFDIKRGKALLRCLGTVVCTGSSQHANLEDVTSSKVCSTLFHIMDFHFGERYAPGILDLVRWESTVIELLDCDIKCVQ